MSGLQVQFERGAATRVHKVLMLANASGFALEISPKTGKLNSGSDRRFVILKAILTMQKQILLLVTFYLLLAGCDRKEKEVVSPTHTLATTENSKAAEAQSQTSKQLSQQNGIQPQPVSAATPEATLAIGEKVYKSTCSICHKSGLNGAPRVGRKQDWESRLAQGNDVLYSRAINGYRGKKGSMPSRGSNPRLSDAEVKAAVDYIVANAVPIWSVE